MGVLRRWGWVVVLVVGFVLFEAVRQALAATGNPALLPSLILLGAAVVPVAFVAFIAGRLLGFGVSGGTVALTALIGGVIGAVTAGVLEFDVVRDLGTLPLLLVGVIEEAAKLIVPVVLVIVLRHRRAADGLLLGVASGAGFAALETMGYAFVVLVRSGGQLAAVDEVLLLRGVLSPAAHMAWTGLTAAALWHAALAARHRGRAYGLLGAAFAGAVALHTAWDAASGALVHGVIAVVGLALLTWTAHRTAVADRGSGPVRRGAPGQAAGASSRDASSASSSSTTTS